ncbi:hypothetical protein Scep_029603 [Stephania cephalantha]|uniref:Uncharacterized protein n=1 Tax=Stephania cephalantha TaxID=152367 RepID=A0AAP0E2I1_9MAGN
MAMLVSVKMIRGFGLPISIKHYTQNPITKSSSSSIDSLVFFLSLVNSQSPPSRSNSSCSSHSRFSLSLINLYLWRPLPRSSSF